MSVKSIKLTNDVTSKYYTNNSPLILSLDLEVALPFKLELLALGSIRRDNLKTE